MFICISISASSAASSASNSSGSTSPPSSSNWRVVFQLYLDYYTTTIILNEKNVKQDFEIHHDHVHFLILAKTDIIIIRWQRQRIVTRVSFFLFKCGLIIMWRAYKCDLPWLFIISSTSSKPPAPSLQLSLLSREDHDVNKEPNRSSRHIVKLTVFRQV